MYDRFISTIIRFRNENKGGVIILFVFALIPILVISGVVIDFGRVAQTRAALNAAADSAALAAVSRSQLGDSIGNTKRFAEALFDTNARAADVAGISREIAISESGATRSATARYSVAVPTIFAPFIGMETITVSGTASASGARQPYIDFYLLLDNSPSMGLAATYKDMEKMRQATPELPCAFACHEIKLKPNDAYALARKLNVTLRIDLLRDAAQRLTEKASASAQFARQYRMGVYTLGPNCDGTRLTTIQDVTADLSAVRAEASRVDLMAIPKQDFNDDQCTDFTSALRDMDRVIDAPGDGLQASLPQKVLYLVSDGLADFAKADQCNGTRVKGTRCQEPIDPRQCETLKQRGIKIAVLYTTYLPLPDDGHYNSTIAPWAWKIAPSMQQCASPNLYFEVTPSQGLAEAMKALFDQVVANARLTQ